MPYVFAMLKLYWTSLSLSSLGQFLGWSRCEFSKIKSNPKRRMNSLRSWVFLLAMLDLESIFSIWFKLFLDLHPKKAVFQRVEARILGMSFVDTHLVDTFSVCWNWKATHFYCFSLVFERLYFAITAIFIVEQVFLYSSV